ncbi:hypothetical protein C8R45DRAFT_927064 [Mycena sanguinolenta]|nr:hypothetical protein C8R45DRAFT_927064 [Mycena sanguinolenta]
MGDEESAELVKAQKRAEKKAAREAAKAREEQALIEAGVWNTSKKRPSSAAETSVKPKKTEMSRSTAQASDSSEDDNEQPKPAKRVKTTTEARTEVNRRHAAPPLSDAEDEPVVPIEKKKNKAAAPAAAPRSKGRKPKSKGKKPRVKSKPLVVPESESSASSSDSSSSSEESSESDSSEEEDEDELDNGLVADSAERPQVIPLSGNVRSASPPPKPSVQRPQKSMLDAPPPRDLFLPGVEVLTESDTEMPPVKSRRSSSVSSGWSSGPGTGVPDTDYEALESLHNSGSEDMEDLTPSVKGSRHSNHEPKPKHASVKEKYNSQKDPGDVPLPIKKPRKSKKDGNVELPEKDKVPKRTEDNTKLPKKELSARQRKANQEKPQMREIAADVKATRTSSKLPEPEVASLPETAYHPSTRLVFPVGPGKDMKLTEQSFELRAVLNATIERITSSVILVDAYPEMASRTGYAKANMLKVARKIPDAVHIPQRLESDQRMPTDRISTVRSKAKKRADTIVPGLYQFAHLDATSTKTLVEDLIADHKYIFPKNKVTIDREQPYRHPAIIAIAKQEWFTGSFAAQYATYFKSTRPKFPEKLEMATPVLALAATAILAALSQYQLSGTLTKVQFKESAYEESYRYHLNLLEKARSDAPTTTARLMHEIYNDIIAPRIKTATLTGPSIISLIEVADSD